MTPVIFALLGVLVVVAWARPVALVALHALHVLQLEEYQTGRFWRWLASHGRSAVDRPLVAGVAGVIVLALVLPGLAWLIAPIGGVALGIRQSLPSKQPEAKKPLVLTARARRLLASWVFCAVVVAVIVFVLANRLPVVARTAPFPSIALALLVVGAFCWPLMSLANLVVYPVEAGFRRYYLSSARRILRRYHPVVIGVAGSYGKTSTKSILVQIVSTRHPALATPRSFNTPMGLCRVIREQLRPECHYFVAELGAYKRGEIEQLCRLVRPSIGVLTAVGPEHLERFGSMENVVRAEFELIDALPADGLAVFNGDDDTCRELSVRCRCRRVLVGGPPDPRRTLWAEEVRLTSAGLDLTVCASDGQRAAVTTRLLGRHNVANVLAASAAALACGMSFGEVVAAIPRLEPIEHRLQLIPNGNGIAVIDDTYNSNPRGAATALETLGTFEGGRRYLVTPGMVELADLQDAAHREFGRQAAEVCDGVILIGPKQTNAIADGLVEAGFGRDRLIVTRNLAEATELLKTLLQRGDAVLFENDLPDNYDE